MLLAEGRASVFTRFMRERYDAMPFTDMDGADPVAMLFAASLASLEQHLSAMADHHNKTGEAFRVAPGYVDALSPTAFAARLDGCHVIAMHTGLAVTIQELAFFAMAQADIFPGIGESGAERSPRAEAGHAPGLRLLRATLASHGARLADASDDMPAAILPVDPERHVAAVYFAALAMRFVWMHELAHGLLGHVDMLRSLSGNGDSRIDELGLVRVAAAPGLDPILKQGMEFEADRWGLRRCLMVQHQEGLENIHGIAAMPQAQRLSMALFAVFTMTWLFEAFQAELYRQRRNLTHPAPFARLAMLRIAALEELQAKGLDGAAMVGEVMESVETLLPRLGWDVQADGLQPDNLCAIWETLRSRLEPFRYVTPD